jgi:hypothetical protein
MPAPTRPNPITTEPTAIAVPKGIVGVYTDLEVDALLASIQVGGGGTVDLSAYATTAYVDGQVATVYTKAEVDAAIAAAMAGVAPADLSGLATKPEVEAAVSVKADQTNPDQTIKARRVEVVGVQFEELGGKGEKVNLLYTQIVPNEGPRLGLSIDGKTPLPYAYLSELDACAKLDDTYRKAEVDAALANVATGGTIDLGGYATTDALEELRTEIVTNATTAFAERYTKQEVDGLFVKQADMVAPPSLDGYATEQYVDDTIARIPAADLSAYAKLQDADQAITAKSLTLDNHRMLVSDNSGQNRLSVAVGTKTFPVAYLNDLSAFAMANNEQQIIVADRLNLNTIQFGSLVDPKASMAYGDTNEGYGDRLVLVTNKGAEFLVYKSDLEGQVADKTPWQRLTLEAGWRNGPGAYPAAEVRWNGDNLEFRGVAEVVSPPAVDSSVVFARLPAEMIPATIRAVAVPTMQGTAGGIATLQVRPDGTLKVSFRLITASQVCLDFTLPGAK